MVSSSKLKDGAKVPQQMANQKNRVAGLQGYDYPSDAAYG